MPSEAARPPGEAVPVTRPALIPGLDGPRLVRLLLLTWVTHFALLLATSSREPVWGDAAVMCAAAASLVDHGSLDVPKDLRVDVSRGADGRHYTKFPLLNSLACVPAVLAHSLGSKLLGAAHGVTSLLVGIVPAGWGGTLAAGVLLLALLLGASTRAALWLTFIVGLSTPLWVYSRSLYAETQQAALLTWTILAWLAARRTGGDRRWLMVAGLTLGLAINAKWTFCLLGLPLVVDHLWGRWSARAIRELALFAGLGFVPGLAAALWYNAVRFGSFLGAGYQVERDAALGFATPLWSGLYGVLFSSGKSLFLYAPVAVVAAMIARRFASEHRRDLWILFLPTLALFALVSTWWAWSGDWAWGPRLHGPLLPLLLLPLLCALERGGAWRGATLGLAGLGLLVQLLGVLVAERHYLTLVARLTGYIYRANVSAPYIRDDLLLPHFVPELSPIVGHAWLVAGLALGNDWATAHAPWDGLGVPRWRVGGEVLPPFVNLWFDGERASWVVAVLLAVALVLLLRRLRRSLDAGG